MKFLKKLKFPYRGSRAKIKSPGSTFILFVLLIGAVAVNSGNNLTYLTFSTILSFFILSGLLAYFNMKNISIELDLSEIVFANKNITISVKTYNKSRMPKFMLNLNFLNREETFQYINVVSIKNISTQFKKRGIEKIPYITVSSSFPFGFFERSRRIRTNYKIIVAPEVKSISLDGRTARNKEKYINYKGKSNEFYSVQEYREGEDARKISWPISAKTDKLIMIDGEKENSNRIKLFLDNSSYLYTDVNSFEMAVEKVTSAIYLCYINKYEVSLISEKTFPFSHSKNHFKIIFEFLAIVQLKDHIPLTKPSEAITAEDINYA